MANARLQVEKALYTTLNVDGVLSVAPGGVHNGVAVKGSVPPWVTFQLIEKTDIHTFDLRGANMLYLVKAVSDQPWPKVAMDVDTLIDSTLEDAALFALGYKLLCCRRESAFFKVEESGGKIWQHIGGTYRIIVDEIVSANQDGSSFVWGVSRWGYPEMAWA